MRLLLQIAYDGSDWGGWQSQSDGRAIQDRLEAAFAILLPGARTPVHGAGRTDAGVHAIGQCAHVDVPDDRLPATSWPGALNAHLPPSIRVMSAETVNELFHARFSAVGKIYRYRVWNARFPLPTESRTSWHVPRALDRTVLEACARLFVGEHDFAAFCAKRRPEVELTRRTIHEISIAEEEGMITLDFIGTGFLYKMVRMLTAAIVRCATGQTGLEELSRRLAEGCPRWNHVAPACGLSLRRVLYQTTSPEAIQPAPDAAK